MAPHGRDAPLCGLEIYVTQCPRTLLLQVVVEETMEEVSDGREAAGPQEDPGPVVRLQSL